MILLLFSGPVSSVQAADLDLSGIVFEDVNYGGGAGRDRASAGGTPRPGATVELYDSSGAYVASTTTDASGAYTFTNLGSGTYYVRVVNATVTSGRPGADGTELGVQTFRSNNSIATTSEVGGRNPAATDAAANPGDSLLNLTDFTFSGGSLDGQQTQSVQSVSMSATSVSGVDFGFNFNTIVNVNESGQGSLGQFILNSNLLENTGLDQVPNALFDPQPGHETSIFMVPNGSGYAGTAAHGTLDLTTNGVATIQLSAWLPSIDDSDTHLNGYTQQGAKPGPIASRDLRVHIHDPGDMVGQLLAIDSTGSAGNSGVVIAGLVLTDMGGNNSRAIRSSGLHSGGGHKIQGNYIGVMPDGVTEVDTRIGDAVNLSGTDFIIGVELDGAPAVSQGGMTDADEGNLISGYNNGLMIEPSVTATIAGNYFGVDKSGMTPLTAHGGAAIHLWQGSGEGIIGGTNPLQRNLIVNGGGGVNGECIVVRAERTTILGNYIGVGVDGLTKLGNCSRGIMLVLGDGHQIGDGTVAGRNIIGGAGGSITAGVGMEDVVIDNNYLGVGVDGTTPIPSLGAGILFDDSSLNGIIRNNIIAHQRGEGIAILGGSNNIVVSRNRLYANDGMGINLAWDVFWMDQMTRNDANDADDGPNSFLNRPQFESVLLSDSELTVNGCAPGGSRVELFEADVSTGAASPGDNRVSTAVDYADYEAGLPTGGEGSTTQDYGEGEIFLGDFMVSGSTPCGMSVDADRNDPAGLIAFSHTLPLSALPSGWAEDRSLTATATLAGTGTSEFSAVKAVDRRDYGDAPASYGDAAHAIVPGLYLGEVPPDSEAGSQYSYNAYGDGEQVSDSQGTWYKSGDEDGAPSQPVADYIPLFPPLKMTDMSYSLEVKVTNTRSNDGVLVGWIDFDANGTFEADEGATVNVPANTPTSTVTLNWTVPVDIQLGTTFIRLRLTTDTAAVDVNQAAGHAADGEVEDYALAVALDIPPDSSSVSVIKDAAPVACQSVLFSDDFNDLATGDYIGPERGGVTTAIRNWNLSGGGGDTYARTYDTAGLGLGTAIHLGNGAIRRVVPGVSSALSFDTNGRLTTTLDAIELRDDVDDVTPGTTVWSNVSASDWGVLPVTLSRSFTTEVGKRYRLYFKTLPKEPGGSYVPGLMRVDVPGGGTHIEVPGSNGGMINYAVEFTADSTTSTVQFVNYGHIMSAASGWCDPVSEYNNNPWCTVGGGSDNANEAIIDDIVLAELGCGDGAISGTVFTDTDLDDLFTENTDTPLANITVWVYDENGTTGDESDDVLSAQVSTDSQGAYIVTDLAAATTYRIEVNTTDPDLPAALALGTVNPRAGVTVADGMTRSDQDFGFDNVLSSVTPALNYRLDECRWDGTAGEVLDSSGNNLHGIAVNGADTSGDAILNRSGQFVAADSHYVNAGDVLNDIFGRSNQNFTLTAWVRPDSLSSAVTTQQTQNTILAKTSASGVSNIEVGINDDGRVHVYLDTRWAGTGVDYYADFGAVGSITPGNWYFVAVSYDGSAMTVHINDEVYTNTGTWSTGGFIDNADGSPLTIGASLDGANYFDGKIDEVKVFGSTLSQQHITALYTNEKAGLSYEGLSRDPVSCSVPLTAVGEYRFDDCGAGNWSQDYSVNDNDATGVVTVIEDDDKDYACTSVVGSNLEIPHIPAYEIDQGAISFMMYDQQDVSANRLLRKGSSSDAVLNMAVKQAGDNQTGTITATLNGNTIDTGEAYYTTLNDGSELDTQWVHVLLSFGSQGMKLYINGELKGTDTYTGGIRDAQGAFVLAEAFSYLDEFYIFDGQPSDAQVQTVYNNLINNRNLDGSNRECECGSSNYTNNYCVTPSGATGLLSLGDIPVSAVSGAGTYHYTDRTLPGFGTVDVTVNMTGGRHNASVQGIDGGSKQQSWLDEGLPATGASVYLEPDSDGTATVTYNFDQPTGNLDLLLMDIDFEDAVTITAQDETGADITDFSGWRYRAGDLSVWQNPDPVAQAPLWDASTATVSSTDDSNDHRSFGMLTPDVLVTQITVTFNAPAVAGRHVYTTLHTTDEGRDGEASCPLPVDISGRAWFDSNSDGIQNDGAEAYIEGAKVELYDSATTSIVATTRTDSNGYYSFSNTTGWQAATPYELRIRAFDEKAPFSDWSITTADAGTDYQLDSDAVLSGDYWVINMISPVSANSVSGYDFGFAASLEKGCLDIGSVGVSGTFAGAHGAAYNFLFADQQVTGYCAERNESDPLPGDNYEVQNTDRQGLTEAQRQKLRRLYSALEDPDVLFSLAGVSPAGGQPVEQQPLLDAMMRYMTWYYTHYNEDRALVISSRIDDNSTFTPEQKAVMRDLLAKIADRVDGLNGENQYPEQTIFWLWNMTDSSRQDIVVPEHYIGGSNCPVTGIISGTVYTDQNGNDSYDTGTESGIGSVTVTLLDTADGSTVATTTTAADGDYRFADVATGPAYRIQVDNTDTDLNGKTMGTPNPLTGVNVSAGEEVANQNFGFDPILPDVCGLTFDNPVELRFDGSNDGVLESGTLHEPGSTYRVSNIAPGIDGIVTLISQVSDEVTELLEGNIGAALLGGQETMHFDLELRLVDAGTSDTISTPVDLLLNSQDLDGDEGEPYSDGVVFYDADATFMNVGSALQPTYYPDRVMYTMRVDARGYNDRTTDDPSYSAGAAYTDVTRIRYGGVVVNNTYSGRSIKVFGTRNRFELFTDLECNPPEGSVIRGTVYTDLDEDDTYDTGEPGLPAISVSLYNDNGTAADTSDDTLLVTSPTEADGRYNFGGLDASLTYRVVVDTADGDLPAGYTLGTANPLTGLTVTAGGVTDEQNFGFDPALQDISGRVYEDTRYGGGAGRAFGTVGTVGIEAARVELYDSSGTWLAATTTGPDGAYNFANLAEGDYYVRVVNASVSSSRAGSDGTELGVQTFRSDGSNPVTGEVGGRQPDAIDAGAHDGTARLATTRFVFIGGALDNQTAQSVTPVRMADTDLSGVDFGFNFNTIVNTRAQGQGSLAQFIDNSNLLESGGIAQQLPASVSDDYSAGDTVAVFMIPAAQQNSGTALIEPEQTLSVARSRVVIDGRMQQASPDGGSIVIQGDSSQLWDGLHYSRDALSAVLRDVTVRGMGGSGIVISGTGDSSGNGVRIEQVAVSDNGGYGVLLENGARGNQLLANRIHANTWAGVGSDADPDNTFSRNQIVNNGALGIDLGLDGVTANRVGDSWLNYPEVEEGSSISSNGSRVVTYDFDLNVPGNAAGYRVEFFSNVTAGIDPSGHGEGQAYLGYKDITHPGGTLQNFKGTFNANQPVPEDANIAAVLLQKTAADQFGATSEFSGVRNGSSSICTSVLSDPNAPLGSRSINENTKQIKLLEARDSQGEPIHYVISGGADSSRFVIRQAAAGASPDCPSIDFIGEDDGIGTRSLGAQETRNTPVLPEPGNYEVPVDQDRDNVYEVEITATDSTGRQVTRSLSVQVQDVNEKPRITSAEEISFTERQENTVVDLESWDPDAGDAEGQGVTYRLAGGADARHFSLDPATGVLEFVAVPDYEQPRDENGDNQYEVKVRAIDSGGLSGTRTLNVAVTDDPDQNGIQLRVKALLQGPYDDQTGWMKDDLRALGILPVGQPYNRAPFNYTGTETINLSQTQTTGAAAMVDWVLLELRAATNPEQVVQQMALLLRRDGELMTADTGATLLEWPQVSSGDYFVSLRHRNHLWVITAEPVSLSMTETVVDFSRPEQAVAGEHTRLMHAAPADSGLSDVALLWSGDIDQNQRILLSGTGSDIRMIFGEVLGDPGNTGFNSSYQVQGYRVTDLNMDGRTLFMGPANDANIPLANVLVHPGNEQSAVNYIMRGMDWIVVGGVDP